MAESLPNEQNGKWPAFPGQARDTQGNPIAEYADGLTKRELFAAMALQGLIPTLPTIKSNNGVPVTEAVIAEQAVIFADALLAALLVPEEKK
jgi:hypothetical protein